MDDMIPKVPAEHPVVEEMTDECRQMLVKLRTLAEGHFRQDILARYEIGTLVSDIMYSEAEYGDRAVLQLEEALGWRQGFLYECQRIANGWTKDEVEEILGRTDAHGNRITWSHFVVLSSVCHSEDRDSLLKQKFSQGLSVRQLSKEVDKLTVGRNEGPIKPRSPWAGLKGMKRKIDEILELEGVWNSNVYSPLTDQPLEMGDERTLDALNEAREATKKLLQFAETNLKRINASLRDVRDARKDLYKKNPLQPRGGTMELQRRMQVHRRRPKVKPRAT